ncbi:hypothetical protein OC71_21990 [Pseudomonas sp. W15Feb9B]|nr:hypothetical protein OC71_21990 [Pseudomonas sp. W15Feb9B]
MARIIADGLGNRKFGEHSRDERDAESDFTPTVGASLLAKAVDPLVAGQSKSGSDPDPIRIDGSWGRFATQREQAPSPQGKRRKGEFHMTNKTDAHVVAA